jgi:hypothetical protein
MVVSAGNHADIFALLSDGIHADKGGLRQESLGREDEKLLETLRRYLAGKLHEDWEEFCAAPDGREEVSS